MNAILHHIDSTRTKFVIIASIPYSNLRDKLQVNARGESEDKWYQRSLNGERVNKIKNHIKSVFSKDSRPDLLFPSAMILASDQIPQFISKETGEIVEVEIDEALNIVDGQHRFYAMKALEGEFQPTLFDEEKDIIIKNKINDFRFPCVILYNYDLYEQAKIFADVNFNQKSVNRSLFYDIYGSILPANIESEGIPRHTDIFIAHNIVQYLNTKENSVLKGYLKMLGKEPGFVTQSFFVNALMEHLSPKGIWGYMVDDLKRNGNLYENAIYEITAYLGAVRGVFFDWWPKDNDKTQTRSIICKTTGLGALIKLLRDAHYSLEEALRDKMKAEKIGIFEYQELTYSFKDFLSPLKNEGERFFSLNSEFAKGGGAGLQSKLYNQMRSSLMLPSLF